MKQEIIENRVKKLISKQLNIKKDHISNKASFSDDLGADSLDLIELIMSLEEEFKNEIQGEIEGSEAEQLKTVENVINYIHLKSSNKK